MASEYAMADDNSILTEDQLFEELCFLIRRAEKGGVASRYLRALFLAGEKMLEQVRRDREEQESSPFPTGDEGRISDRIAALDHHGFAHCGEQRFPVEIVDLGARGFGVVADQGVPAGSFMLLEVPGAEGIDVFSCFVVFCREKEGRFRIGLRIFALLPKGR